MYTSPDTFIEQVSRAIDDLDLPATQPVANPPATGLELDAFRSAVAGLSPDHRAAISNAWSFLEKQLQTGPSREVAVACLQVVIAVLRARTGPEAREPAPVVQPQHGPASIREPFADESTGDEPITRQRQLTPTDDMPHVVPVAVPSMRLDSDPGLRRGVGFWRIVATANLVLILVVLSFVFGDSRKPEPDKQDIVEPVVEMLVESRPGQNFRLTVSRATAKETPDARFLELMRGVRLDKTGLVLTIEQH